MKLKKKKIKVYAPILSDGLLQILGGLFRAVMIIPFFKINLLFFFNLLYRKVMGEA